MDQIGKFHRISPPFGCIPVHPAVFLYVMYENMNNTEDVFGIWSRILGRPLVRFIIHEVIELIDRISFKICFVGE